MEYFRKVVLPWPAGWGAGCLVAGSGSAGRGAAGLVATSGSARRGAAGLLCACGGWHIATG